MNRAHQSSVSAARSTSAGTGRPASWAEATSCRDASAAWAASAGRFTRMAQRWRSSSRSAAVMGSWSLTGVVRPGSLPACGTERSPEETGIRAQALQCRPFVTGRGGRAFRQFRKLSNTQPLGYRISSSEYWAESAWSTAAISSGEMVGNRSSFGLLPTMQWSPGERASPSGVSWGSRRCQVEVSLFAPAVPPTHKQRARAVSSGQSRSLEEDRWTGRRALTWGGGGGRNCITCKGSGAITSSARQQCRAPCEVCRETGRLGAPARAGNGV